MLTPRRWVHYRYPLLISGVFADLIMYLIQSGKASMFNLNSQRLTLRSAILLLLFVFTIPQTVVSGGNPSTVDGSFQIVSDDGPTRHIEFHVARNIDGSVIGDTTFRDDPSTNNQKENIEAEGSSQPFYLKANFDCLVINKNNAVMSGAITEASSPRYLGRRVLVVAQDNGGSTDPARTDRLTWGIYYTERKDWYASDSERPPDEVGPLAWIATDSEREDDQGILSNKETVIGCQSFPLSSFAFVGKKQGRGNVRVRP